MILYVATGNHGKLRDFAEAARAHGIVVLPLPGLREIAAPPEDGATFEANARAKAVYYSHFAPANLVMADDSGLEVDALHGAPGVRSARYADDSGFGFLSAKPTDHVNNDCLLAALDGAPDDRRTARYRAVLAVARNGEVLHTASGSVEGRILTAPRGSGGFGYDPLFHLPELGQTMAEISSEQKHTLSHRGRAFRALLERLGA